jgi:uncharacterized membrane protein
MTRKERLRCAISGRELPRDELVPLDTVSSGIKAEIWIDYPQLDPAAMISRAALARYRARYVESLLKAEKGELSDLDRQVALSMATHETMAENTAADFEGRRTFGERLADRFASFGGSWSFILLFLTALLLWTVVNTTLPEPTRFDPYPFILLNLVLSCLAALQAPVIMMSQKRQEAKDRLRSQNDYRVNLKAELEIRHLHEKIDHLISRQWQRLAEIQQLQIEIMQDMAHSRGR